MATSRPNTYTLPTGATFISGGIAGAPVFPVWQAPWAAPQTVPATSGVAASLTGTVDIASTFAFAPGFTIPAGVTLSTVTSTSCRVNIAGSVPVGAYSFAVDAVAAGQTTRSGLINLSVLAPPAVEQPTDAYRYQQRYLFQTADSEFIPNRMTAGVSNGVAGSAGTRYDRRSYGPTAKTGPSPAWRWTVVGGDWIDSAGVRYGGAATNLSAPAGMAIPINSGSETTYTAQNCTAIVQQAYNGNRWLAMLWRSSNAAAARIIYGKHSAFPPLITVTYNDGTVGTLPCRITAANNTSSDYVSFEAESFTLPIFVEFERPTKPVASASITFRIKQQFSGTCNLQGYLLDPPVNTAPVDATGLAQLAPLDAGLVGNANVLVLHRYLDGTSLADFSYNNPELANFSAESIFDPAIYGSGPQDLTKHPHVSAGKWAGLPPAGTVASPTPAGGTGASNATLVPSTYVGEGFTPLAPGLGAIKWHLVKQLDSDGLPLHDGSLVGDTLGSTILAQIFLPDAEFGICDDIYVRQHVMIGTAGGSPWSETVADRYQVHQSGTSVAPTEVSWTDKAGKWLLAPDHHCVPEGGFSATAGGTHGWQDRYGWFVVDAAQGGPAEGGYGMDLHVFDIQVNPVGNYKRNYNYASAALMQTMSQGGMGMIYAHRWYCVEQRKKLNTVLPYYPGFDDDGILQVWVDDRLVADHQNVVFRQRPINRGLGAPHRSELMGINQFSQAAISGMASGEGYAGVTVRNGLVGGLRNYYVALVSRYSATHAVIGLARKDTSRNRLIHLALTDPIAWADGDVLRLEATGNLPTVLTVKQNGSVLTLKWYTNGQPYPAPASTELHVDTSYSDAYNNPAECVGLFACNNTLAGGLFIDSWSGGEIGGTVLTDDFTYANADLNVASASWVNNGSICPLIVRSNKVHADPVHRTNKSTTLLPARQLGHRNLLFNWFHGGQTRNSADRYVFMTGVAAAKERIGAMKKPTAALPSWVPAPGELATLTSGAGITNKLNDVCAPYYPSFTMYNVRNGDAGPALNPHWGAYGGLMIHGAGHGSTNDNSLVVLEYGSAGLTFKRLTNPTAFFGTGTDATTQQNNATGLVERDINTAEYLFDGQPASAHTYGSGDVLGPDDGGGANGTYISVIRVAAGHQGELSALVTHKVDLPNTTGAPGDYVWQRVANNAPGDVRVSQPIPCWTQFVRKQKRIYYEARWSGRTPRWLNTETMQYEVGTGASRVNNAQSFYTGILVYAESRDLLLFAAREGTDLVIRYMRVGVADSNPTWVSTPAALSQVLPVPVGWSCMCWCPDNNRLIVGNIATQVYSPSYNLAPTSADTTGVYEIAIPSTLTDPWVVERVALPDGQSIQWPTQTAQAYGAPTYKSWDYNPKTKSIVYYPIANTTGGNDRVYVYRPRGT